MWLGARTWAPLCPRTCFVDWAVRFSVSCWRIGRGVGLYCCGLLLWLLSLHGNSTSTEKTGQHFRSCAIACLWPKGLQRLSSSTWLSSSYRSVETRWRGSGPPGLGPSSHLMTTSTSTRWCICDKVKINTEKSAWTSHMFFFQVTKFFDILFSLLSADNCICYSRWDNRSCREPSDMRFSSPGKLISRKICPTFLWFPWHKANLQIPAHWSWRRDWNFDGDFNSHLIHTSGTSVSEEHGEASCALQQVDWI